MSHAKAVGNYIEVVIRRKPYPFISTSSAVISNEYYVIVLQLIVIHIHCTCTVDTLVFLKLVSGYTDLLCILTRQKE